MKDYQGEQEQEQQQQLVEKEELSEISSDKTWTWLIKNRFNRETELLLITAQNNNIRTNLVKARIDKAQKNCRCRLWDGRDETMNYIKFEYSKLAPKLYETRRS